MAAGDIRLNLNPAFGALIQEIARQPLDEANARLGKTQPAPPAAQSPTASLQDPALPANRFIPTMLPLPTSGPQRPVEVDRRTRNIADVREAFRAFEEPADDLPAATLAQARAVRALPDDPLAPLTPQVDRVPPGEIPAASRASTTDRRPEDTPLRLRAAPAPIGNAAIDSLQASTTARATRTPAPSQPVLMMIGCAVVAAALAWIIVRMVG